MRTAINISEITLGQVFNRGEMCSSKYVLLEKESKIFNGVSYSKIQHLGIELTGIDFSEHLENNISFIPSNSIVYLKQ